MTRQVRKILFGICALFILKGAFTACLLPIWKGFDEWLHYSYIAYVSRTGSIPILGEITVPKEIAESLEFEPGSPELTELKNDFSSDFVRSSWQAQHPPLFYILLSPLYSFMEGRGLLQTLQVFRFLSILILTAGLFPAFLILRRFQGEEQSNTIPPWSPGCRPL